MNENTKKIGLVVLCVVGAATAVFGGIQFFKSDQPVVEKVIQIPEGSRSMKDIEMENQERQKAGMAATPTPDFGASKDEGLGGSISPN